MSDSVPNTLMCSVKNKKFSQMNIALSQLFCSKTVDCHNEIVNYWDTASTGISIILAHKVFLNISISKIQQHFVFSEDLVKVIPRSRSYVMMMLCYAGYIGNASGLEIVGKSYCFPLV